jgi:ABC-type Fe3+/spermidine/putrescine transport system ATPase subunit
MTKVAITNLTKHHAGVAKPALYDLSLDINSGELLALLGPSGCGKTTALKLIAGLLDPTSGDVTCDGNSIMGLPPDRRGVVMVFQSPLLFPYMSVADNIGFGLRMRGLAKTDIAIRVADMMERVKLSGLGDRKPSQLSGGQQQRAALARALILEPKVLLLDEPFSSLDATLRGEMRNLTRALQKSMGITTIFVTHDQEEAIVLGDRIAVMMDGRLQQYGQPQDFYSRPASVAVARFFGGENFFLGSHNGVGGFTSALGTLQLRNLPDAPPTKHGILTFRPESVRLGQGPANQLDTVIIASVYLGTHTRLTLDANGSTITATVTPDHARTCKPGDRLTINLPPESLWILPSPHHG